jgi:uncharacterized protein YjiS (DUF1127 family)
MPCTVAHQTIRISLPPPPAQAAPDWPLLRFLDRLLTAPALCLWLYRRRRGRRQLLDLDDRLLHDIGLTREQAEAIVNRPFWR